MMAQTSKKNRTLKNVIMSCEVNCISVDVGKSLLTPEMQYSADDHLPWTRRS